MIKNSVFLKIGVFFLLTSKFASAQISIGSEPLFMSNASILTVDGLSLKTDGDFLMTNNTIRISHVYSVGEPRNSITRTYTFQVPVHYHGTVGIHYSPAELNGNDEKKLQIAVIGTTSAIMFPSAQSTVVLAEHYVYNTANLPLLAFSAMDPSPPGALPVKLTSFDVTQEKQNALLSWFTSMETNSDHFEIQKSRDAKKWESIGVVTAVGESDQEQRYGFNDPAFFGKSYYRLKMFDRDGSSSFSRIRFVEYLAGNESSFYPNPVQNQITLTSEIFESMRSGKISDLNGRVVKELQYSQSQDVSGLLPAVYILTITRKDGSEQSQQMMKQ